MNKYGNATQFAKWLGVSTPYITQLKKAGKLVYAPDGKRIDFEASKQRIALYADIGKANNGLNAKTKRQPETEYSGFDDDMVVDDWDIDLIPMAEIDAELADAVREINDWIAENWDELHA